MAAPACYFSFIRRKPFTSNILPLPPQFWPRRWNALWHTLEKVSAMRTRQKNMLNRRYAMYYLLVALVTLAILAQLLIKFLQH